MFLPPPLGDVVWQKIRSVDEEVDGFRATADGSRIQKLGLWQRRDDASGPEVVAEAEGGDGQERAGILGPSGSHADGEEVESQSACAYGIGRTSGSLDDEVAVHLDPGEGASGVGPLAPSLRASDLSIVQTREQPRPLAEEHSSAVNADVLPATEDANSSSLPRPPNRPSSRVPPAPVQGAFPTVSIAEASGRSLDSGDGEPRRGHPAAGASLKVGGAWTAPEAAGPPLQQSAKQDIEGQPGEGGLPPHVGPLMGVRDVEEEDLWEAVEEESRHKTSEAPQPFTPASVLPPHASSELLEGREAESRAEVSGSSRSSLQSPVPVHSVSGLDDKEGRMLVLPGEDRRGLAPSTSEFVPLLGDTDGAVEEESGGSKQAMLQDSARQAGMDGTQEQEAPLEGAVSFASSGNFTRSAGSSFGAKKATDGGGALLASAAFMEQAGPGDTSSLRSQGAANGNMEGMPGVSPVLMEAEDAWRPPRPSGSFGADHEHGKTAAQAGAEETPSSSIGAEYEAEAAAPAPARNDGGLTAQQSGAPGPPALVTMLSLAAGLAPRHAAGELAMQDEGLHAHLEASDAPGPGRGDSSFRAQAHAHQRRNALTEGPGSWRGAASWEDGVDPPHAATPMLWNGMAFPVEPAHHRAEAGLEPGEEVQPPLAASQAPGGDVPSVSGFTASYFGGVGVDEQGFPPAALLASTDKRKASTDPLGKLEAPGWGREHPGPAADMASSSQRGAGVDWAEDALPPSHGPFPLIDNGSSSQEDQEAASESREDGHGAVTRGEEEEEEQQAEEEQEEAAFSGDDFSEPEEVEIEAARLSRERRIAALEPIAPQADGGMGSGEFGSGSPGGKAPPPLPLPLQHEQVRPAASEEGAAKLLSQYPSLAFDELVVEVEAQVHLVEDEEERRGNPAAIEAKSRRNSPPLTRTGSGPFGSSGAEEHMPDPELEYYQEGADFDIPTAEVVEHDEYFEQEEGADDEEGQEGREDWQGGGDHWGHRKHRAFEGQEDGEDGADFAVGTSLGPWSSDREGEEGEPVWPLPPVPLARTSSPSAPYWDQSRGSAGPAAAIDGSLSYSVSDFERGLALSSAAHLDETLDLAAAIVPEAKEKDWAEAMAKVSSILGRPISVRVDSRTSSPGTPSPLVDSKGRLRYSARHGLGSGDSASGSGSSARAGAAAGRHSVEQRLAGAQARRAPSGTIRGEDAEVADNGESEESPLDDGRELLRSSTDYGRGRRRSFVLDSKDFELWKERKRALQGSGSPATRTSLEGTRRMADPRASAASMPLQVDGPAQDSPSFSVPANLASTPRLDGVERPPRRVSPLSPGESQVSHSNPGHRRYQHREGGEHTAEEIPTRRRHSRGASVPDINLISPRLSHDTGKGRSGATRGSDSLSEDRGRPLSHRGTPVQAPRKSLNAPLPLGEERGKVELLRGPHTGLHIIQTTTLNDKHEWE